jgi:hypothetical protein
MCNERFNLFLAECQEKVLTGVLCLSIEEEILISISLLKYNYIKRKKVQCLKILYSGKWDPTHHYRV